MTAQALDYPTELAGHAYQHNQTPNKAAREHTAFIEHMEDIKGTRDSIANTARQRDVLDDDEVVPAVAEVVLVPDDGQLPPKVYHLAIECIANPY